MRKFDLVEDAIEDIRKGRMVIVADDESRENEGDLVCAAETVTPEIISFMINHGRGLVCAPISDERASRLELPATCMRTAAVSSSCAGTIEPRRGWLSAGRPVEAAVVQCLGEMDDLD